jgi:hypothetical protein
MCDGRPIHANVVFVAKFQELPADKLGPIVGDDGIRYPELVDDVSKERHSLLRLEVCKWSRLDPFGELIHGDQQVSVAPRGTFLKGPTMSSPHTAEGHVTGII